jgi:type VI secretion system FHA domain protein
MTLTLEITGPQAGTLGTQSRKVFHDGGGTIGRLPKNDVVLADSYVSGTHAVIQYKDGNFYIEDRSVNGVFINKLANRLAKGLPYALKDGDLILIEPYEIRASISSATSMDRDPWPPVSARSDVLPLESADPSGAEIDWFASLGGDPSPPVSRRPTEPPLSHRSPLIDHLSIPVDESSRLPSNDDGVIPSDWNDPPAADDRARMVEPAKPLPQSPPKADASQRGTRNEPADRGYQVAPARARAHAPEAGADDVTLAEVLEGAGIHGVRVTPELARDFGRILRVVVSGVVEVLKTRRDIKHEFRLGTTMFARKGNNPLKMSVDVDDALHKLLVQRNSAYLPPVEAFQDAFDDVRNHEMAMLQGIRVAYNAMMEELKPERLQEDFDQQVRKGALLAVPAKLRYWDLYCHKIEEMLKDPDATFRTMFGEEFAKAYEHQLKQLKSQKPREEA